MTTQSEHIAGINPSLADELSEQEGRSWLKIVFAFLGSRGFGLAMVALALLASLLTFAFLLGYTGIEPTGSAVITAILVNGSLALLLAVFIATELYRLVRSLRQKQAAARMHWRIVSLFGIVSTVPAIVVAIVAGITLDRGLDRWFAERTRTIVASSQEVARAYIRESARTLQGTTLSMAAELDRNARVFRLDPGGFEELFTRQARGRGLLGAALITGEGELIIHTISTEEFSKSLPQLSAETMAAAGDGDPKLISPGKSNIVGALIRLPSLPFAYLYTTRELDSIVRNALTLMENNTREFGQLSDSRVPVQLAFGVLYLSLALILLLSAIWLGIAFADRLVSPIRQLIGAATEVRGGNMNVRVPVDVSAGDVASLSDTFNRMISDLDDQQKEILTARDAIDKRRRFTEAVLYAVTPAVMGVDNKGIISISNPAAQELLGSGTELINGKSLKSVVSAAAEVLQQAIKANSKTHKSQATLMRAGRERTWNIQVTEEKSESSNHSYVVTIDDITELVMAQRDSAWGDVARRIAHEIKNPLTPIQLSAERLKRRYGSKLEDDREVFDNCTETIVRQVADIGRMVDEFSQFARMPKPTFQQTDIRETIKEAVFLREIARPEISFSTDLGEEPLLAEFDTRLVGQAIGNVVKNAAESIEAVLANKPTYEGQITIKALDMGKYLKIEVIDNGKGLPEEGRQQLLEPYMTTRDKGTGLGLAIVRKIMEDHGGTVDLTDAPDLAEGQSGAMVSLTLAKTSAQRQEDKDITIKNSAGEQHVS